MTSPNEKAAEREAAGGLLQPAAQTMQGYECWRILRELRNALAATYALSPEGRAYLARIDAALAASPDVSTQPEERK
jgi:hypothetical protein